MTQHNGRVFLDENDALSEETVAKLREEMKRCLDWQWSELLKQLFTQR